MGMYTELFISTRIKDVSEVVEGLRLMLGETQWTGPLPKHPLFSTPRWRSMLVCSSYYFVPRSIHKLEHDTIGGYWVLISRSDFKNYDNEINLFIDWIRPYLDVSIGEMIGYHRYEECDEPTIIYA